MKYHTKSYIDYTVKINAHIDVDILLKCIDLDLEQERPDKTFHKHDLTRKLNRLLDGILLLRDVPVFTQYILEHIKEHYINHPFDIFHRSRIGNIGWPTLTREEYKRSSLIKAFFTFKNAKRI